jgi:predicted Zn-dependent protease
MPFGARLAKTQKPASVNDPGAQEKLAALGYQATSTDSAAAATGSGADPKDKIEIGNLMGEANYLEVIRLDEAAALLQKVIAKEPNLWIAYAMQGATEFNRGNLPGSVKASRKAVKMDPDSVNLHYELGNLLIHAKDYEAAVPELEIVEAKMPGS